MSEPRLALVAHLRAQIKRDPEAYANNAKLWAVARSLTEDLTGQSGDASVAPTTGGRVDTPNVVDRRADHSPKEPSEFHKAVAQIALQAIGQAQNKRHLAALAKAQVVAGRAVRRVITRCELLNREPVTFSPTEVAEIVMEEDATDEAEGTGR